MHFEALMDKHNWVKSEGLRDSDISQTYKHPVFPLQISKYYSSTEERYAKLIYCEQEQDADTFNLNKDTTFKIVNTISKFEDCFGYRLPIHADENILCLYNKSEECIIYVCKNGEIEKDPIENKSLIQIERYTVVRNTIRYEEINYVGRLTDRYYFYMYEECGILIDIKDRESPKNKVFPVYGVETIIEIFNKFPPKESVYISSDAKEQLVSGNI